MQLFIEDNNYFMLLTFPFSDYRSNGVPNATLYYSDTKTDVGKGLIEDGFIIVEKRPGRRFAKIVSFL